MAMNTPTRRAAICAIAALPVALTAPAALAAVPASHLTDDAGPNSSANPRLRRAMALHTRAALECERFDVEVHSPASQAFAADLAAYPHEPEPTHEQVATTFVNWDEKEIRLSTNSVGSRASADRVVNDSTWADMGNENWRQAFRELHALHQRRDGVIAEQKARLAAYRSAARKRHQLAKLEARAGCLADRSVNLWRAVLATPSQGVADMAAKVAFIEKHDDETGGYEFAALAADVKRLAAGAMA
ncbi:hypothetical protein ACFSC3_19240 [Sphingomonas floccifaciens]|uniref:DUF922 domain-containing protein n=1 Tax=Sphingomonas floccifaciens TaxID=1844115 RepID=A0ABW4NHZ8_9SPHN